MNPRHYAGSYLQQVLRSPSRNTAVGGLDEQAIGAFQAGILATHGLLPAERILELGCGTGRVWNGLPKHVDMGTVRYTGLDVVPGLVRATNERLRSLGLPENRARAQLATSFERYPVGYGADTVFAFSVFTHMEAEDIVATLRALRRCCSPDARGLFTFLALEHTFGTQRFERETAFPFWRRYLRVRNVSFTRDMAERLMELGGWRVLDAQWGELPDTHEADGSLRTNQSWLVVTPVG